MATLPQRLMNGLGRALRDAVETALRPTRSQRAPSRRPRARQSPRARPASDYPGDFTGTPTITYSPRRDGTADPGEVVWTWVPYEEDHSHGKDRPVVIIGRDHGWLLGLMLSSQDHERDAREEASHGRYWIEIGSGEWDKQGRPSAVRVDRVIRVDADRIRRISVRLDRPTFDLVAAGVRKYT